MGFYVNGKRYVTESVMAVSSPCRHVTSILTVLYNTDTCAIHLPTQRHPQTIAHLS